MGEKCAENQHFNSDCLILPAPVKIGNLKHHQQILEFRSMTVHLDAPSREQACTVVLMDPGWPWSTVPATLWSLLISSPRTDQLFPCWASGVAPPSLTILNSFCGLDEKSVEQVNKCHGFSANLRITVDFLSVPFLILGIARSHVFNFNQESASFLFRICFTYTRLLRPCSKMRCCHQNIWILFSGRQFRPYYSIPLPQER